MKELYIFCEGPTEQGFCQRVLQPHLFADCDGVIHAVRIANSRRHNIVARGGVSNYLPMKNEIIREFSRHRRPRVLFTSMIDLYALPSNFPGKQNTSRNPDNPRPYVEALEQAFASDLDEGRFIPHLQLHEFETLVFAEPAALGMLFDGIDAAIKKLEEVVREFRDAERINDSPTGAPSKRIASVIAQYRSLKATVGPDVTEYIGMQKLMSSCNHFSDWVSKLQERLQGI